MRSVLNSSVSLRERTSRLRFGFTIIELMVVIVIIAILIGILVPAISKVRQTARDAEARKDISDLEQAIAQFKVSFGIEPPSRITLYAQPGDWDSMTYAPDNKRDKGIVRQIWPKFDFATCGGASNGTTFYGTAMTTPINLNGAECLVFFLGGLIDPASGAFVGFGKDPARPFALSSAPASGAIPPAGYLYITNREGPFFEFKGARNTTTGQFTGRLTDVNNNLVPEYRDPLPQQTQPYLYFSAASGNYRTAPTTTGMPISMSNPWINTDCGGLMNYAYYSKFNNAATPTASLPYKPKSFQIISPGPDARYGTGGFFDPNNNANLSADDRDNITNFHPGRLGN